MLCDLLLDFGAALRGWGGVVKARISAASRRRATSFSSWISGHSFRSFCFMGVTAGDSDRSIGNIGHCIYCDAEVYSKKPHVRDEPFGDEHIIPEGMGGNLVLEDASCESCEGITGLKVENQVLGRTLIAVIHHWGLRTRKKPPAPMRLMGQNTGGKNVTKPIPIDDYPIVFYMLKLLPIELSEGDPKRAFAANGVIFVNIKPNLDLLKEKYGIINPAMPHWNLLMFVRMLAKIGHSLGAAELGLSRFKPLLLPLIKKGTLSKMRLVGGPPSHYREGESEYDHEVSLGYQKAHGTHYVVAKVRLFAKYGGPTYFVVVGESLESRMARFNRVLSNKISFMLRR